jgi:peptidyl-prolyl cis-trans isomerase A (cyclophilin A)
MRGGLALLVLVALIGCGGSTPEVVSEVAAEAQVEVVLSTGLGEIVLELYPQQAPVTVENFLRHVDGGNFDGAAFYRVVRPQNNDGVETMQLIQGGLFGRVMAGVEEDFESPYPPIAHETTEITGILHERGVISMARLEPGTASSEFFIMVTDGPELDFGGERNPDGQGFAAFGRVISGMGVVDSIHQSRSDAPTENEYVQGQILNEPVVIIKAERSKV